MYSDTFEKNFMKYIDLLPQESLKFLVLDATPKPEERCEAPYSNNTKIRFDSVSDLREYAKMCIQEDMRIMSLHAVYQDKTFIHLDILIPRVKVFNRVNDMTPQKLFEEGLLGPSGLIHMYELVF